MQSFREFLLFSFLAIVSGRNNFKHSQHLMEPYSRNGALETIPWASFSKFEQEWRSMSKPALSPATTGKLNSFFDQITVGKDNHHRAMDSIAAMCKSAEDTLPQLMDDMDRNRANRLLRNIMNAFQESKAHLNDFKYNLESAAESIDSVNVQSEISNADRITTDFNHGTDTIGTEGAAYGSKKELLGEPLKRSFFERLNNVKSQLDQAIKTLNSVSADMEHELNNFVPSKRRPSSAAVNGLLTKCVRYNPAI